jgi:hypothetical protein
MMPKLRQADSDDDLSSDQSLAARKSKFYKE